MKRNVEVRRGKETGMDNREEKNGTEVHSIAIDTAITIKGDPEKAESMEEMGQSESGETESKKERKKREKAEKKKKSAKQGDSLVGSTMAKVIAFLLMITFAIVGVTGLYGTLMLANYGAYSVGKTVFIHDMLYYRKVSEDLYKVKNWYEDDGKQTMEAYCRQRNIWVKVENYDADTEELLDKWTNADYQDLTNHLTYTLESQIQRRSTSSASTSNTYSGDMTGTADSGESSIATEQSETSQQELEAFISGNLEHYLKSGETMTVNGEKYILVNRAEEYAQWVIEDALTDEGWYSHWSDAEKKEKTLAERNLRVVVTITVDPELPKEDDYALIYRHAESFYDYRNVIPVVCGAACVLALLCFIFLLCSAGHKNGREGIVPSVMNEIQLDLYTVIVLIGAFIGLYIGVGWIGIDLTNVLELIMLLVIFSLEVVWCTIYCMEVATRLKLGKWWQNTLVYKVLQFFARICKGLFHVLKTLFRGIPMVWRTVLLCLIVCLVEFLGLIVFYRYTGVLLFFWGLEKIILCLAVTFAAILCKNLQEGSEALAEGDLNYHLDTSHMILDFKEHGENLNRIGEGISAAVEQRMKSEHLKTELITNVSHDIKTPLTSIINYADLIGKEVAPDEVEMDDAKEQRISEYAEVLLRQSKKLKKLLDDLLEASKATTGNLEVHPEVCDVSVLLSQAVGEYEQRFAEKGLNTIVRQPEETVKVMADGRHLWRVFDNLFNNIYKYAQPDSRVYLNVEHDGQNVNVIFRNMSAFPLEMSPEELEERFTRGDKSRHMEGNGLGLSIAKSLTELQHGSMEIVTDGDLFKVVITLPETEE